MAQPSYTDQELELLRALFQSNEPVPGKALAAQLGVSERTVRNRVGSINHKGEKPLVKSGRSGYTCDRVTVPAVLTLEERAPFSQPTPQTRAERRAYALKRIIQSPGPLNIYDLCEELFVSASTMRKELGRMMRTCAEYDLELSHTGDMLSIQGTEKNKRRLLSGLLYEETSVNFMSLDTIQHAFPDIDAVFIRDAVAETLEQARYFVNEYSLINLVLHIAIALDRIKGKGAQHATLPKTDGARESVLKPHEADMAASIARKLEDHFDVPFSGSEEYELALLLASRTTTLDYNADAGDDLSRYVDADCLALVDEIIGDVSMYYFIDLSEKEFYVRFALHIKNLLARARTESFARNPLTDEIKSSCPLLYDTAVGSAGIIKRRTGIQINDDEIAYIAFHLGSTIEAQKQLNSKVKTVLYCPAYYNIDKNLQEFLNKHFSDDVLVTNIVTTERALEHLAGADLIITTNPIAHAPAVPVLHIGIAPRDTDVPQVRAAVERVQRDKRREKFRRRLGELIKPELFATGEPVRTREEIIHAMSARLIELGYVNEGFEDDVLEREHLSSTAFGAVAVPHTMKPYANESSMSVLVPDEPVAWGDGTVSLVIMLAFSRGQRATFNELFDPLVSILIDPLNVRELAGIRDYQAFIDRLGDMLA